jgi:DNA-binding LytR/AlgR family response regulator
MILDYSKQIGKKIITKGRNKILIEIENICFIKNEIDIAEIHLSNGEIVCEIKTLKDYEKELSDYGFYKISRNTIINGRFITEIKVCKTEKYLTIGGKKMNIAKRMVKELKKLLIE